MPKFNKKRYFAVLDKSIVRYVRVKKERESTDWQVQVVHTETKKQITTRLLTNDDNTHNATFKWILGNKSPLLVYLRLIRLSERVYPPKLPIIIIVNNNNNSRENNVGAAKYSPGQWHYIMVIKQNFFKKQNYPWLSSKYHAWHTHKGMSDEAWKLG